MGTIKAANNGDLDYTQWGVVRDQKELVYYFFSTFNINLFAVDLKQFDLSQGTPQTMPLIQDQWVSYLTPLATA
jgi:penicillin V acylase-like amidase (Ntn superfamily)